jgi:hypothetical protein
MFEVGIVNGEGQWVILMGEFATQQDAERWRMLMYRRGSQANMEVRERSTSKTDS